MKKDGNGDDMLPRKEGRRRKPDDGGALKHVERNSNKRGLLVVNDEGMAG